jgi:hypothetical protein
MSIAQTKCNKCSATKIFTKKSGLCRRCYDFSKGWNKFEFRQKAEYGTQKNHPLSKIYRKMLERCSEKSEYFSLYTKRGIKVCKRWTGADGFNNFVLDMGPREGSKSIDRIDNNKGYSPKNCRWATAKQQAQNRSSNRNYIINGEKLCLKAIAEKYGIKRETLTQRLNKGMSIELAVNTPVVSIKIK